MVGLGCFSRREAGFDSWDRDDIHSTAHDGRGSDCDDKQKLDSDGLSERSRVRDRQREKEREREGETHQDLCRGTLCENEDEHDEANDREDPRQSEEDAATRVLTPKDNRERRSVENDGQDPREDWRDDPGSEDPTNATKGPIHTRRADIADGHAHNGPHDCVSCRDGKTRGSSNQQEACASDE
jgi:hypothetical protein